MGESGHAQPLKGHQVIRHRLVDMATRVTAAKELVYRVAEWPDQPVLSSSILFVQPRVSK